MAIGGRWADAGPARGIGEGESGGPFLGDQFEGGANQRLLQVAVMVSARSAAAFPTHVKGTYMAAPAPSTELRDQPPAGDPGTAFIASRSALGIGRARPPDTKAT